MPLGQATVAYSSTNKIKPVHLMLKVFIVMVYPTQTTAEAEVHSVYATREAAETKAANLRSEIDEITDQPKYSLVAVGVERVLG